MTTTRRRDVLIYNVPPRALSVGSELRLPHRPRVQARLRGVPDDQALQTLRRGLCDGQASLQTHHCEE